MQDINKPWPEEWKESFDLVHQRLVLVGGGSAQQQVLGNLAALVKPGGWIQLIEATNELPDGTGPAFRNFVAVMQGVFVAMGSSVHLGNDLQGWLEAAGFENVENRILSLRLGAKNPDPKLAKQGVYSTTVAARGLATFGKSKFLNCLLLAHETKTYEQRFLKARSRCVQSKLPTCPTI